MGVIILIGQILLGLPFVVFAYWYQREEALFRGATPQPQPQRRNTMFWHGAFGIFFSVSFATLGILFFPPITGAVVLSTCIYLLVRALDNIDHNRSIAPGGGANTANVKPGGGV
jgi:uncharacterized membrane protein